jgi:hypothetical protein
MMSSKVAVSSLRKNFKEFFSLFKYLTIYSQYRSGVVLLIVPANYGPPLIIQLVLYVESETIPGYPLLQYQQPTVN